MKGEYYQLPFSFGNLMKKGVHAKCTLKESIFHHLHLLVTTSMGEFKNDETYGNDLWNADFDTIANVGKFKEDISQSLISTVNSHEKRLDKIRINVGIKQSEIKFLSDRKRIKRKITIQITGIIKKTNEPFKYIEEFYLGPLSYN